MSLLTDIQALQHHPTVEAKAGIAEKISYFYNCGVFDENEEIITIEILRLLVKDTEQYIRQILSQNLKQNVRLPHDIALTLAHDVLEVASPMLEFSEVLTDEDLLAIIKSTDEIGRLLAISRRNNLSENLCESLFGKGFEALSLSVVANEGANISPHSYMDVLRDFSQNTTILETIARRGALPISIAERVISRVSAELQKELVEKHHISSTEAHELMTETSERATLDILSRINPADLAKDLQRKGKLSTSIVLRSLCKGDLDFFTASLSLMADIPMSNAKQLLHDKNPLAFESLYKKAGMPRSTMKAASIILRFAIEEHNHQHQKFSEDEFSKHLLQHIVEGQHDRHIPIMRYFMVLIGSKIGIRDTVH